VVGKYPGRPRRQFELTVVSWSVMTKIRETRRLVLADDVANVAAANVGAANVAAAGVGALGIFVSPMGS
jgi:hypothetical protein